MVLLSLTLEPHQVSSLPPEFAKCLDMLGTESGVEQNLKGPITNCVKFGSELATAEKQILYILATNDDENSPSQSPTPTPTPQSPGPWLTSFHPVSFIKTGLKHLYLLNPDNKLVERDPLCILDFYVGASHQRKGFGKCIFDIMVASNKNGNPEKFAYDRPSKKMYPFLAKQYGLREFIEQSNNYVVFTNR
ncbi:hypothetical protein ScalyP_jg7612 [Parmales sp. scaly parma]|nr:hypothetical protein ScalyP_jg7612 [Parmales sp. scaly parma]